MQKAVLDRYEDGVAVFILDETDDIMTMPRSELSIQISEGDHVLLEIGNNTIQEVELDEESTEAAKQRIQEKIERLRRGEHLKSRDED